MVQLGKYGTKSQITKPILLIYCTQGLKLRSVAVIFRIEPAIIITIIQSFHRIAPDTGTFK